ncbi:MAG: hypothetical protein RL385_3908 [Pseudomonadota bacterium]
MRSQTADTRGEQARLRAPAACARKVAGADATSHSASAHSHGAPSRRTGQARDSRCPSSPALHSDTDEGGGRISHTNALPSPAGPREPLPRVNVIAASAHLAPRQLRAAA